MTLQNARNDSVMSLKISEPYGRVIDKSRWAHAHGRNIFHIEPKDIESARLFSYAYRSQTIGAFHATRVALREEADGAILPNVKSCLDQADTTLKQLEDKAIDLVPRDYRAVISTLYYYDYWVHSTIEILSQACAQNPKLQAILQRFVDNLNPITSSNGIYSACDVRLPEQGAFIVPNLGIAIKPIIYGDYHSWNAAFLMGGEFGVPIHRHTQGAEIHLGFSPVKGQTILGANCAEIDEGYAMAVPPMTDHGFQNTSGHDHVVPFVFGSLLMSGWGIFFDVEPHPEQLERQKHPLDSTAMNQSVFLERVIHRAATAETNRRQVIVAAECAGSAEVGGLELAITHVSKSGMDLNASHYRIVSVQAGSARVCIGSAEREVVEHDHFGIPAGMSCQIQQTGEKPLVVLDSMILPIPLSRTGSSGSWGVHN